MKKEYYLYIIGFLILIAWVIYYNRPLPSMGLIDPGEAYFTLPERTLPSSWDIANKEYDYDNRDSEENKKLANLDKIFSEDGYKKVYLYTEKNTGNEILTMNRDAISEVFFSGDNTDIIQYHIDNFGQYLSGYELYPPRLDFSTAIPRFQHHQSIYRVGSIYSASLCYEGKIAECTENFKTLFKFSQQMKNSSTLISLLIGIVEEDIAMSYITYLYNLDPTTYRPVITMLHKQEYLKANKALRYAFMWEYQLFRNAVTSLPLDFLESYDMIDTISGGDQGLTEIFINLCRVFRIPPKRLFDAPETISLGRGIYSTIIDSAISPAKESFDADINLYRTKWHPVFRKNIIGYTIFNAILPRLTGMKWRVKDAEQRYYTLINK